MTCSLREYQTKCSGDLKEEHGFSPLDWKLLLLRAAEEVKTPIVHVCDTHNKKFLLFYDKRQTKCCDPENQHPGRIKKGSFPISVKMYNRIGQKIVGLIPGKKLCPSCYSAVTKKGRELDLEDLEKQEYQQDQALNVSPEVKITPDRDVSLTATSFVTPVRSEAASPTSNPEQCLSSAASAITDSTVTSHSQGSDSDPLFVAPRSVHLEEVDDLLNYFLKLKGIQIDKEKVREVSYCRQKFKEICFIRSSFEILSGRKMTLEEDLFNEMLHQLKTYFEATDSKLKKIQILSILPQSCTRKWVMDMFGLPSDSLPRLVKRLVKEQGLLPSPTRKPGHGFSEDDLEIVKKYYEEDSKSVYMLPDKSQSFSIKIGNQKVRMQKRLILCNLKELHACFKKDYPLIQMSFSKFASLRPKYCVLAGSAGTHTVCVCEQHQNVKLKIEGAKLRQATRNDEQPLDNYRACLKLIKCYPISHLCAVEECPECPADDSCLRELIDLALDLEGFEEVVFQQWVKEHGQRLKLEVLTKSREEFVDSLIEDLYNLVEHDFIAKQQAMFLKDLKANLKEGEVIIIMDFSENYPFLVQEAIQSFHWVNDQATVVPCVIYHKDKDGSLKNLNYVVISDNLKHTVYAVHIFQKKLIDFVKSKVPNLKKILYFTDGAASQFKSFKSIANLCFHLIDFGVAAEHHYFATSHGKSNGDGIGGILKRSARRASLQGVLIRSALELYEWAATKWNVDSDGLAKMYFCFVPDEDIRTEIPFLTKRFNNALKLPEIMKMHSIIPLSTTRVVVRRYSTAPVSEERKVREERLDIKWDEVNEDCFITFAKEEGWYLAKVVAKEEETQAIIAKVLEPQGPSKYFRFSSGDNESLPLDCVLTLPKPRIQRKGAGNVTLLVKESNEATKQLSLLKDSASYAIFGLQGESD